MNPSDNLCPPAIVAAFNNYIERGVPPGDFVRACLENNLVRSVWRADNENLAALPHIVAWLYWNMPANMWQSPEAVNAHLKKFHETITSETEP